MTAERAEPDEAVRRLFEGIHRLLLCLAGRVPDEFLTHTRSMLAEGDLAYLPDTLTGAAAGLGVSLTATEVELLRDALVALGPGGEPAAVRRIPVADVTPVTGHRFAPASPEVPARAITPASTEGGFAGPADLTDDLVIDTLTEHDGVVAIRRAWRFGPGTPPHDGKRIYLAEVEPGVPAWDLTLDVQHVLIQLDQHAPQVEVYWSGDDLPPYHRTAHGHAALLWRRAGTGE
ncbi:hypothetical protein [Streptosporangium sp. KLBMP 9127]|nr:hypothetical protein [Streptosporangium sp. KLBMP 9127]